MGILNRISTLEGFNSYLLDPTTPLLGKGIHAHKKDLNTCTMHGDVAQFVECLTSMHTHKHTHTLTE